MTDPAQDTLRLLVKQGRFEFVTGGWEQHDTACPTYQDMLLNIQKGHQFLAENLGGYTPRTAWAVDKSGGHSIANPRLLAEAGIEAIFILNIEQDDRDIRLGERSMEFVWRPQYNHLGRRAELFGHIFYDFETSLLEYLVED